MMPEISFAGIARALNVGGQEDSATLWLYFYLKGPLTQPIKGLSQVSCVTPTLPGCLLVNTGR